MSNYKIYSIQYEMSLLYQIRCQAIHSSTDKCFIISLEYVLYHYRYFYRKAYQCCKVHYTYVIGQANIGFFRNVSFVKGLQTILKIHSLHLVTAWQFKSDVKKMDEYISHVPKYYFRVLLIYRITRKLHAHKHIEKISN